MYIADPDRFVRAFEFAQRDAVGRERRRVAFKRHRQQTNRNRVMKFRLNRYMSEYDRWTLRVRPGRV